MAEFPTSMVDFYDKYGDEIKALRVEMGERVARRLEDDDRPSRLRWVIASLAVQGLMSSILASMFRTEKDRMEAYPQIMKMLIEDTESLCRQHQKEAAK